MPITKKMHPDMTEERYRELFEGNIYEASHCGVRSIGVTWGFHERSRLEKGNFAAIIDSPRDLPGAVRNVFNAVLADETHD